MTIQGVTWQHIEQAATRMREVVHHTPLDLSRTFSQMLGVPVYLKLENLQKTGSFKIRGAYNKVNTLTAEEQAQGVIAASAGNHAQGVAYAAARAGIPSVIVMPETAPLAKISATRGYGAKVVLFGKVYDEAFVHAQEYQHARHMTFVPAFDDAAVIAGQGTVGLEMMQDQPELDTIVVPIGGGGLIAGMAMAIKHLRPNTRVIGVQAAGAPAMCQSVKAGELRPTKEAITFADGIAVKVPGTITFDIIQRYVDDVVLVSDEEVASTILMLLERCKLVAEGAGAVALAALLHGRIDRLGRHVAAVISGGNIDVNFVSRIIERGLVKAGRRVNIKTNIKDRPGELQALLKCIGDAQVNVVTVVHDRLHPDVALGQARVALTLETRDMQQMDQLSVKLRQHGYEVQITQ